MPIPRLVNGHLEKKINKWTNGVDQRIKKKLADTYNKAGCIIVVKWSDIMLEEYSIELISSRKLVVKLGQNTCLTGKDNAGASLLSCYDCDLSN